MLIEELIERAFCEGYEYAQKEYARRDYEGLTKESAEKLQEERNKIAKWAMEQRNSGIKSKLKGKQIKTRIDVESPNGVHKKSSTNWWKSGSESDAIAKEKASKVNMLRDAIKAEKEHLRNKAEWDSTFSTEKVKDMFNKKSLSKRDLAILGGSAAALIGGTVAYKKHKKKKEQEKEQKEFSGFDRMMKIALKEENRDPGYLSNVGDFKNSLMLTDDRNVAKQANKYRNIIPGARTISQINNISDNHSQKISEKRMKWLEEALKNRDQKIEKARLIRKAGNDRAIRLKNIINNK